MQNDYGRIERQIFLGTSRRERNDRRFAIVMFTLCTLYFGGHLVNFFMR